ncbi:PDZ domain-containing RING finger protein 4-like isoform X2 [Alosa sapidissima]|uniref:PDZ domain-containing RING finger protein 4-like isoform X2 n=1 Tax=Alosa sapidissima TaxID=34773 RepID=UPI001C0819D3|nr:PDZ domain-containing RING finger protein 4-like isoform X2 [Alosa sapidissima]
MGCNLCTLQKREEHYKLLYEIAQVNGKDLSRASHEEAVEAFRSAKDPIVVQVLRRNPVARPHGPAQEVQLVDVCTQTEITFEHIMALAKLRPSTPPVPDICPFLLSDSCQSLHTVGQEYYDGSAYLSNVGQEYYDGSAYLSNVAAGVERMDDFEYEVGPNSIAARDGRIREGDRILQINGQDVQDREEAVVALSSEDSRSIVLLVARPELQLEEGWLDDEHSEFLEELKMEMLEEQRREEEEMDRAAKLQEQPWRRLESDISGDTPTCSSSANQDKDSGLGHAHVSSEQEMLSHIHRRLTRCLRERREVEASGAGSGQQAPGAGSGQQAPGAGSGQQASGAGSGQQGGERGAEGERVQQLLELKCQIRNSGEYDLFYSRSSTIECSRAESGGGVGGGEGVERELRMLNEELRSIELECQSIMQAHQLRKRDPRTPPLVKEPGRGGGSPRRHHQSQVGGSGTAGKLADINEHPEKSDKDNSSSAYNTAESSRSTPLAMDRSPEHSLQRLVSLTNQRNLCSTLAATAGRSPFSPSSTSCPARRAPSGSPDHSNPSESEQTPPPADEEASSSPGHQRHLVLCSQQQPRPAERSSRIPYFSPSHSSPHRHAHIPAHARHYQSYMHLVQQRSAVEYAQSQLSLFSMCPEPQVQPEQTSPSLDPKLEWKVKVRSDGTRYITKRPVRDRLLRERALKISEERSGGMTTDDDAMSEMKMGRYWSKEERKQQLTRAKEQRRRRQFMQRSRLDSLRENPQSGGEGSGTPGPASSGSPRKEVNIIELSHRKMMKKRNKKILDNWMTIQELMTHGAKAPEGAKVHNAFLSVTTV